MKPLFVGAALALAILSPSYADEISQQCPKPGTVMTFGERSGTFTEQLGMVCRSRGSDGKLYQSFLGLDGGGVDGSELKANHAERLFPLRVGNEIEFTSQSDSSHLDNTTVINSAYIRSTIKIVREEKITTRAGAFNTFVIEWHKQALGRVNGTWLITLWFAPEVGYTVKSKIETRAGYGPDSSLEITSLITAGSIPAATGPGQCLPGMKFGVYDDCKTPAPSQTLAPASAASTPRPVAKTVAAKPAPVAKTVAPTPAAPPTTPTASSVAERLQTIQDLLDRKVITPEEYTAKRKEILRSL